MTLKKILAPSVPRVAGDGSSVDDDSSRDEDGQLTPMLSDDDLDCSLSSGEAEKPLAEALTLAKVRNSGSTTSERTLRSKEPEYPDILRSCSHWHTVLISMQRKGDDGHSSPGGSSSTVLHFWPPTSAGSSAATHIPTTLSFDQVRRMQFFNDLGTVVLPIPEKSSPREIHEYLTSLAITSGGSPSDPTATDEGDLVERIGQGLLELRTPRDGGLSADFAAVSIRSDAPDALHASGNAPAWNWVKCLSHYRPRYSATPNFAPHMGKWYSDVAKAVDEGSWQAATDFMLVATGFEEHHRDGLRAGLRRL